MTHATNNVLKSNTVKLAGVHRIGKNTHPTPNPDAPAIPAKVKIIDQQAGFSILEVNCPCGEVIQLRCVYPTAPNLTGE